MAPVARWCDGEREKGVWGGGVVCQVGGEGARTLATHPACAWMSVRLYSMRAHWRAAHPPHGVHIHALREQSVLGSGGDGDGGWWFFLRALANRSQFFSLPSSSYHQPGRPARQTSPRPRPGRGVGHSWARRKQRRQGVLAPAHAALANRRVSSLQGGAGPGGRPPPRLTCTQAGP
jgi:hypothetical protein